MHRTALTVSLLAAAVAVGVAVPATAGAASRAKAPKRAATTTAAPAKTTTAAPAATTAEPTTTTAAPAETTTTTSAPATTTSTAAPAAAGYANRFVETFDDAPSSWWSDWGLSRQPGNTAVDVSGDDKFLSVVWYRGSHDGASWFFHTGDADAVHLRYRMRLSRTFDPRLSASDVKMPGFGNPLLDANGACLAGCGGAPADGVRGYSARSDINNSGVPGFYVYDADMANNSGYGVGMSWNQPSFRNEVWYTVDQYIRLNTPGRHDGSLAAYVDGRPVFARDDLLFRTADTLHAGGAWFNFYYGGSGVAPATMWADIDDITIEW